MKVWLVNPFDGLPGEAFRPGRYAFLGRLLAERGHKVTWWSSNFYHTTKSFRSNDQTSIQTVDNLQIVLVKTPRYDRNVCLGRIWNHYVFAREFKAQAGKCRQSPEVIIASAPPLLAANAALTLARRCDARVIIDVQDLWPEAFETAIPHGLRPLARTFLLPMIRRLADRTYDRADRISAVCNTMLTRGLSVSRDKGKGIAVPLGVDIDFYRQCLDQRDVDLPYMKRDQSEFWAAYIGTIGISYDIKTILEAAHGLSAAYPSIRFLIAGDGPQSQEMQDLARSMGLGNVTFTGIMSYIRLTHLLCQCDVGIIAVVPGSRISMPNKLFDYMAAGLPLISSLTGECEALVAKEGIGLQYEAGDAQSLRTAVLHFYDNGRDRLAMGVRARKLAEERFDMNKTYGKFEELVVALRKPGER